MMKLRGVVDLVRQPGGEPPQRFQLLGLDELELQPPALLRLPPQLGVGLLQLRQPPALAPQQLPLLGERVGHLTHLHALEGLVEDEQPLADAQPLHHLLPGVIRVRRAEDDLEVRVLPPEALGGLHAVHSRRHADVDEGQGVRPPLLQCGLHALQPLLSLEGGVHLEAIPLGPGWRRHAEERGPQLRE